MAGSHYPSGFANGVSIRGLPILNTYGGNVFWVDSGAGGDGNPGTEKQPFGTIDYAIGRCTASNGDVIMVKAGHTETISAASGIDLDVIGVSIVGLGAGSLRPTLNFTATASTLTMAAADCSIQGLLLTGGIDAVVSMVVVSAADCAITDCEIRDVTGQTVIGILTTAAADRLVIDGFRYDGATAAGATAAIAIVGGDRLEIKNSNFNGNFSIACINVLTTATTDLEVHDCRSRNQNAADIFIVDTITASTGVIGPNLYHRAADNAANVTEAFTGATFVYFSPLLVVNLAGEQGMASNITTTTDA